MAGLAVSVVQSPDESLYSLRAESNKKDLSILLLPSVSNRPVSYDHNDGEVKSTADDFDSCDDEEDYPNEFDFLDQKLGQISRRNGRKKISIAVKEKRKCCQRDNRRVISTSKASSTGSEDFGTGLTNKELRIRKARIDNVKRKRENKSKTKKRNGNNDDNRRSRNKLQVDNAKKTLHSCHRKSVKKAAVNVCTNQTASSPSFYNNYDFVLNSDNIGVKFEDQSYINLLIGLQNREITPEDYDLLLQLDFSVQRKTLSAAKIRGLPSDQVTDEINDTCSICLEDYVAGDERNFLPCGHHFHSYCIEIWLGIASDRCPFDGKEVG